MRNPEGPHRQVAKLLAEIRPQAEMVVQTYGVHDLLLKTKDAVVSPPVQVRDPGALLMGEPASQPAATQTATPPEPGCVLIDLIENHIARNTWRDHGGATSSASVFDGKLVITSTREIQGQIEELLKLLRKDGTAAAAK